VADQPRVLFLFSDTGGGHRSATEAIIEALERAHPGQFRIDMIDVLTEYAPLPFNRLPQAYPRMVRAPRAWGWGFHVSDGHRRARALTAATWPYVRGAARRLVREQPADLVVCAHPVLNAPVLRALGLRRPPFVTVVTDLVTGHALWYHHRADLCLVPTQSSYDRGIAYGMRPEQLRIVGLPVSRRFCQPSEDRRRLRSELDWPHDLPMVLLMGGGEGMGPLFEIARAVAACGERFGLAVVTGRNARLRDRLQAQAWDVPTFIYGFERRMPQMMQAADILVTKAGPSTIAEAMNAGLPMILYSRLPGQEDGNVAFVVENGLGVWAPGPRRTAAAVAEWLARPQRRNEAATACRRLARPDAADTVALVLAGYLSRSPRLSVAPLPAGASL
jgi:1,2-diacylglycerol 3-beta-galactosyltransferase